METLVFSEKGNELRGRVPGSKSIAARALVLSRVFGGRTEVRDLPDCDDTRELTAAMRAMAEGADSYNLGTGGTSLRFFTALAASTPGFIGKIDCSEALRRRPFAPLVDALCQAGADIEYLGEEGRAPIFVRGKILDGSGVFVDTSISSQFLSALLMTEPLWSAPMTHRPWEDADPSQVVSIPYVRMTERLIEMFRQLPEVFRVEGDWSAASYFYELALARPDLDVLVEGLVPPAESLQGDARCDEIFSRLGVRSEFVGDRLLRLRADRGAVHYTAEHPFLIDMEKTPDLVMAVVAGCCFAGIPFKVTGVGNLRFKECDRLSAMEQELSKLNFTLHATPDTISSESSSLTSSLVPRPFSSHGDHRMAMSMAIAAALIPEGIQMTGADDVSKSFPDFYTQFKIVKS